MQQRYPYLGTATMFSKNIFFLLIISILLTPSLLFAQGQENNDATVLGKDTHSGNKSPADALLLAGNASSSLAQTETEQAPADSSTTTGGNFFKRLTTFYRQDWSGRLPNTAPTPRRALPAPLDSPPFPNGDWGYGGSPDIGASDGNVYPLMTALKLENARTKIWMGRSQHQLQHFRHK
jgi:hypothetical protein